MEADRRFIGEPRTGPELLSLVLKPAIEESRHRLPFVR
jgi:hypothetical protein